MIAVLILGTSLIFLPFLNDVFALPKLTLFRVVTILLVLRWLWSRNRLQNLLHEVGKPRLSLDWAVIIWVIISGLATWTSVSPLLSLSGHYRFYLQGFIQIFCYAIVYFVISRMRLDTRRICEYFTYAVLVSSLYGLVQFFGLDPVGWRHSSQGRIWSTLGNPNFFGAFLAMSIPLVLHFWLISREKWQRMLTLASGVLAVICLWFTYSRAAWVSTGVAFVFYLILIGHQSRRKLLVPVIVVLAAAGIFGLSNPRQVRNFATRFASIFQLEEVDVQSRLSEYRSSLRIVKEYSLFGPGLDTHSVVFRQYMEPDYEKVTAGLAQPGYAHNEFVQLAATTGVVGLTGYIFLLGMIVVTLVRVWKNTGKNSVARIWVVALVAALLALEVQNQFSFSPLATTVLWWVLLGCLRGACPHGRVGKPTPTLARAKIIEGSCSDALNRPTEPVLAEKGVAAGFSLRNLKVTATIGVSLLAGVLICLAFLPLVADLQYSRGVGLINKGNTKDGVEYVRRAAALNPQPEIYHNTLGRVLLEQGVTGNNADLIGQAKIAYEKGIRLNPRDVLGLAGAGSSYYHLWKSGGGSEALKRAEDLLEKSVQYDPYIAGSWQYLALVYEKMEMFDKAITAYEKVLEIEPQNTLAHFNLGCIYANRGEIKKARQYWQETLRIDPGYEKAKQYLKVINH